MTEKISHTLLSLNRTTRLRLHVSFKKKNRHGIREDNYFHTTYDFSDKEYISLDFMSYITLEINDGEWDMSKSILINIRNIYHILSAFKSMIARIYKPDTFYIDDGSTKIYREVAQKLTIPLYNIGIHQDMVITPAVVYDDDDGQEYEGVILLINNSSNIIQLTINQLETLYYILKKVDFFQYGYMMVDFYYNNIQTHIGKHYAHHDVSTKPTRKNMFVDGYKNRHGTAESNLSSKKEETSKDFFGI